MSETITIDGVVYSEDKKTLMKYSEEKKEERFYIPDFVEEIGVGCFSDTDYTRYIIIGKNVRKICDRALGDQFKFVIKQIYIPGTVTELEGEIFDCGVDDGGVYYSIEIVGGERGSAIERYCNERGIPFVVFDSSEIETFYSLSPYELKELVRRQSEEEREWYEQDLIATQFCLTIPMYAFADMDFKFKVANMFADYMLKVQTDLLDNVELQEETPEENKRFEVATKGLEELKTHL
jgi:hypothetical protein